MEDEPITVGDWVREKILGSGGFGIVTLWRNTATEEKIAIKKCRGGTEATLTAKFKDRWKKEVEYMQMIQNENIVAFRQLPEILKNAYMKHSCMDLPLLSMEFCTKGDLRQVLNRSENCCGLLESDCRDILGDIKNAISYLHTIPITHRDLKPENIVLQHSETRSNGLVYKLIDLGYAKEIDAKTICASLVGTLQYLAPELLYGRPYSNSVDYWSFGLLAFEVMCGIRPFLHHYDTVPWMKQVETKKSDDICVYETVDKEIIFAKHMYTENHISQCFRNDIESWLRVALEWDPRKRGRINAQLVIFTLLDSILAKKMINVFSVYSYEFLSYPIDEKTSVTTIQDWIERDTKLNKTEQFLLNYNGEEILSSQLATESFDENYSAPMLYVFKKGKILDSKRELLPKLPLLAKIILENPYKKITYDHRKRANAHGLYFIYQENKLYNTLLEACALKINYLVNSFVAKKPKMKSMNDEFLKLQAQKEFSEKILELDVEKSNSDHTNLTEDWTKKQSLVVENINKLKDAITQLTIRYESAFRRAVSLNDMAENYSQHKEHDLNASLEEALSCYRSVKSETKDEKVQSIHCKQIVRIIYMFLKRRDHLLRDSEFHKYMQIITDIVVEHEKIIAPINTAMQLTDKYKSELLTVQLDRQAQVWDLLKLEPSESAASHTKPQFMLGNPNIQGNCTQSYSLSKPLNFITGNSSLAKVSNNPALPKHVMPDCQENGYTNATSARTDEEVSPRNRLESAVNEGYCYLETDTAEIIADNLSLRFMIQDKTNESFLQCKSILADQLNFKLLEEN